MKVIGILYSQEGTLGDNTVTPPSRKCGHLALILSYWCSEERQMNQSIKRIIQIFATYAIGLTEYK